MSWINNITLTLEQINHLLRGRITLKQAKERITLLWQL